MEKRKRTKSLYRTSVKKKIKRALAVALAVLMVNSVIDYSSFLNVSAQTQSETRTITAFAKLSEGVSAQQIAVGAEESAITLPDALTVTVETVAEESLKSDLESTEDTSSEGMGEDVTEEITAENTGETDTESTKVISTESIQEVLTEDDSGTEDNMVEQTSSDQADIDIPTETLLLEGITWKIDAENSDFDTFDSSVNGACYTYVPILPEVDSEGNSLVLEEGVELPQIKVQTRKEEQRLSYSATSVTETRFGLTVTGPDAGFSLGEKSGSTYLRVYDGYVSITQSGTYTISGIYNDNAESSTGFTDWFIGSNPCGMRGVIDVSNAPDGSNITLVLDNLTIETDYWQTPPMLITRQSDSKAVNVSIVLKGNNKLINKNTGSGGGAIVKQDGTGSLTFTGDGNLTAQASDVAIGAPVIYYSYDNVVSSNCTGIAFAQTGTITAQVQNNLGIPVGVSGGTDGRATAAKTASNITVQSGTLNLINTSTGTLSTGAMLGASGNFNYFSNIQITGGKITTSTPNAAIGTAFYSIGGYRIAGEKGVCISGGTIFSNLLPRVYDTRKTASSTTGAYGTYIAASDMVSSLSVKMDGEAYTYTAKGVEPQNGKIWLWLPASNAAVTLNGTTYYGVVDYSNNTELKQSMKQVTGIAGLPAAINAGSTITLNGTVEPSDATFTKVGKYEILDAGTTGATISGSSLTAQTAGKISMRATVFSGNGCTDYTQDFTVDVSYQPVTDITCNLPDTMTLGQTLALTATVTPSSASYQNVVWSVKSGSAALNGSTLSSTNTGTVTVTATIANANGYGTDFTKDFITTVNEASGSRLDIASGSITIKESVTDSSKNTITYVGFNGGSKDLDKNDVITITGTSTYTVGNPTNSIAVDGTQAKIRLDGINLQAYQHAINLSNNAQLALTLTGNNTVIAYNYNTGYSPIHVSSGAKLTIDGDGYLLANIKGRYIGSSIGQCYAATIGGSNGEDSGEIVIQGGSLCAIGRGSGAAIGGGPNGAGYVNITGGTVETLNHGGTAEIGNGSGGSGGFVTITGGSVYHYNSNLTKPGINPAPTSDGSTPVYFTTVDLYAIYGAARGADVNGTIAGGSYGMNAVETDDYSKGKISVFLPANVDNTTTKAVFNGVSYAGTISACDTNTLLPQTLLNVDEATNITTSAAEIPLHTSSGATIYYVASDTELTSASAVTSSNDVQTFTAANDSVNISLSNLTSGRTYHYYIVAKKSGMADSDVQSVSFQAVSTVAIASVEVTDITPPTAGQTLDVAAACGTTGISETTPAISYRVGEQAVTGEADFNTIYTVSVTLSASTGYTFADSVSATVNGNAATTVTRNGDGTLTVTYTFGETSKAKLIGITAPDAITVANGTPIPAILLPATVAIATEDSGVTSATVIWDMSTFASGTYNPDTKTELTFVLNGMVILPSNIDPAGNIPITQITVTVSAVNYTVTVSAKTVAGGEAGANLTGLGQYACGTEATVTAGIASGYNFDGWYAASATVPYYTGEAISKSRSYTFTVTADTDLVAVYEPLGTAAITIDGGASYTIDGLGYTSAKTDTYSLGTTVTVAADNTADFAYWENDYGMIVSRKATYTFPITGAMNLTAVYNTNTINKSTIIFESYYGQVINRTQLGTSDSITLPDGPTRYGYTFTKWSMTAAEILAEITKGTAVITVTPCYDLNNASYAITVNNGSGSGTYQQNDLVTATAAAPAAGQKFSHWTDADNNILSYNATYQFYADRILTITANYVANSVVVEAKGTAEIIHVTKDIKNSKISFVSMLTVPEGCTIQVAGVIGTNNDTVGTSVDGFNKDTAAYVRGASWSGNACRYTWTKKAVAGENWYVRAYLVYLDKNGNTVTVYGDMVSAGLGE